MSTFKMKKKIKPKWRFLLKVIVEKCSIFKHCSFVIHQNTILSNVWLCVRTVDLEDQTQIMAHSNSIELWKKKYNKRVRAQWSNGACARPIKALINNIAKHTILWLFFIPDENRKQNYSRPWDVTLSGDHNRKKTYARTKAKCGLTLFQIVIIIDDHLHLNKQIKM